MSRQPIAVCLGDYLAKHSATYMQEILCHAGLSFDSCSSATAEALQDRVILILYGRQHLRPEESQAIQQFVRKGGWLIGVGGAVGDSLADVVGARAVGQLGETFLRQAEAHPVLDGLRSSLHSLRGVRLTATDADVIAQCEQRAGLAAPLMCEKRYGEGGALLIAPDIPFSVMHIQQGRSVRTDAVPAPDGTADVAEGTLKTDDGCILDWQRDRTVAGPDQLPLFLEPVADELRALLIKSILYAAREASLPLPMMWYWPGGLEAVGLLSHDSDNNDAQKAQALLRVLDDLRIHSTWCCMDPGYDAELLAKIRDGGHEIGFHYDAYSGPPRNVWSEGRFSEQLAGLQARMPGLDILSNKNHYFRWEGCLEFYEWCDRAGIRVEQSKGGSKRGNIGFPFGTCHPWFPVDVRSGAGGLSMVLCINTLTQDHVVTCPAELAHDLVGAVKRNYGVCHFLFHPQHIETEGVEQALRHAVTCGREAGLEWWTSRDIDAWERKRRGVTLSVSLVAEGWLVVEADTWSPVGDATVLVLAGQEPRHQMMVNGQTCEARRVTRYGFEFDQVVCNLR